MIRMRSLGLVLILAFCLRGQSNCRVYPVSWGATPVAVSGMGVSGVSLAASSLATDAAGNIYVAERDFHRVLRISPNGQLTVVAGTGKKGAAGANPGEDLRFPSSIAVSTGGELYIGEEANRVRRVRADGKLEVVLGIGRPGVRPAGGSAKDMVLRVPTHLSFDEQGNLYVVDSANLRVLRVDPQGQVQEFKAPAAPMQALPLGNGRLLVVLSGGGAGVLGVGGDFVRFRVGGFDGSLTRRSNGDFILSSRSTLFRWNGTGEPEVLRELSSDLDGLLLTGSSDGSFIVGGVNGGLYRLPASGSATALSAAGLSAPTFTGDASTYALGGVRTIPNGQGRQLFLAGLSRIVEVKGLRIEVLAGGGSRSPSVGTSATQASLNIQGVTVASNGDLLIYAFNVNRVFRVDSAGLLVDPVAGKAFGLRNRGLTGDASRLQLRDGQLIGLATGPEPGSSQLPAGTSETRLKVYSLTDGSVRDIAIPNSSRLDSDRNGRVLLMGDIPQPVRAIGSDGSLSEVSDFELQDSAVRSFAAAGKTYFVGQSVFRQDEEGRLFRVLAPNQSDLYEPRFHSMVKEGSDGAILLSSSGPTIWRLENMSQCEQQALPYFGSAGRIVASASYADADRVSPNQLISIFAENMDASLAPEEFYGVGRVGIAHELYPSFGFGFPGQRDLANLVLSPFVIVRNQASFIVSAEDWNFSNVESNFYMDVEDVRFRYPGTVKGVAATPALYVLGSARDGLAAAVNQDGSIHSTANGATRGAVVMLFGSGFGPVTGLSTDFWLTVGTQAKPVLPIQVRIGGRDAEVLYAGMSPGLILGLWQINVRIPMESALGEVGVEVLAGAESTGTRQKVTLQIAP